MGVLGEFEDLADDQVAGVVDASAVEVEDLVGGIMRAAYPSQLGGIGFPETGGGS